MATFIKLDENNIVCNIVFGDAPVGVPDGYIEYSGQEEPFKLIGKSFVEPDPEPVKTPVAKYYIDRRHAYPNPGELLDMLWHGMHNDPSKRIEPFYGAILAIKSKIPPSTEDVISYEEFEI